MRPRGTFHAWGHRFAERQIRRLIPRSKHAFNNGMFDTRSWFKVAAARWTSTEFGRHPFDLVQDELMRALELSFVMKADVLAYRQHFQVLQIVVVAVAVLVMHDFVTTQRSFQRAFHDDAVFKATVPIVRDLFVTPRHGGHFTTGRGLKPTPSAV